MTRPLVVVGDSLLDRDVDGFVERLCPEAPVAVLERVASRTRPGGAGLAAALAASDGREVVLVTALADDGPARELRDLLAGAGVEVLDAGCEGETATKTRFRAGDRLLLRVDGGRSEGRVAAASTAACAALADASAVLVADYGRGVAAEPTLREALGLPGGRVPIVWDPHPRRCDPIPGVTVATPNAAELAAFCGESVGASLGEVTARARRLAARWRCEALAVTLGRDGALLVTGGAPPLEFPAEPVAGDPCGAGDRFSSALAVALSEGQWLPDACAFAVAEASRFVATGGAAAFHATGGTRSAAPSDAPEDVVGRVRATGGIVVATGGCFDLLHAGHVATLEAARALGDCLVVCVNSDQSVRSLKGPDRPLVALDDRVAVLRALACVDVVAVFDEPTPAAVLERLRPDVWAKGGDYTLEDLPEAGLVASWGGQAVILPYVEGRSTSRLLEEAAARASV